MSQTQIEMSVDEEKNVFGQMDVHMKKIESRLQVQIHARDGKITIEGDPQGGKEAEGTMQELLSISRRGMEITDQSVDYALSLVKEEKEEEIPVGSLGELQDHPVGFTASGKPVTPKTFGQKKYVDAIRDHMMVFGIGPAGTGKTYLAMAMAIRAFKQEEVQKIILTRPAIEAGENLGFLPGDLQSKIDPYLRPLYDALYQIMGAENFIRNSEKGLIEVAPLAYMRGRTLDNAFIILDEAQNTTPSQMKMFLTRIGFGSKVVITGDLSQKDLPYHTESGLEQALMILKEIEDIGICTLTNRDVVRHPLVQKIVKAYEKYDAKEKYKKEQKNRRRGRS